MMRYQDILDKLKATGNLGGQDLRAAITVLAAEIQAQLADLEAERAEYAAHIDYAREHYADPSDNDIEVDDDPLLSVADDAVWVQAWVWCNHIKAEYGVRELDDCTYLPLAWKDGKWVDPPKGTESFDEAEDAFRHAMEMRDKAEGGAA